MASERTLVHMDLDSFYVSAERKKNPSLIGKPIIIGGGSDRAVVASCSYETRPYGVRSAMPIKRALYLCPNAVVIKGDMEYYSRESALVTQVIADKVPLFEKASIDEHYLDITGMDRFFGCQKWTKELRDYIIKESGLPISYGLSVNKTVSKIATSEVKPNGEIEIPSAFVRPFLDPLHVRKIPGVGEKTFEKLTLVGVSKIHQLREMPVNYVQKLLGENGATIWEKANGIDLSPVVPYTEQKSISTELTFEQDTTDQELLSKTLVSMVEKLAYQLRKENKLTARVVVKIRYSNQDTETKQVTIPYTAYDHTLIKIAKELFNKLYSRRMLLRLVGVRFENLVYGRQQIDLFEDSTEMVKLYQAMDKLRNRYGNQSIMRASGL